jgi:hypothetical protein
VTTATSDETCDDHLRVAAGRIAIVEPRRH